MSAIALVNQKGGVSKSTTALHLVYWLSQKPKTSALLVDTDVQRSSSQWLQKMNAGINFAVLEDPNVILDSIPGWMEKFDYVVIDGPAGLQETVRAILLRCDLAICPVQPSELDLASAEDAIYLIKQAQSVRSGKPNAAMFLSRAVPRTRLKTEAMALLAKSGIPTLKTVIHQRQIIADVPGQQATVFDMAGKPAAEAASEYEKLFKEILGMLK